MHLAESTALIDGHPVGRRARRRARSSPKGPSDRPSIATPCGARPPCGSTGAPCGSPSVLADGVPIIVADDESAGGSPASLAGGTAPLAENPAHLAMSPAVLRRSCDPFSSAPSGSLMIARRARSAQGDLSTRFGTRGRLVHASSPGLSTIVGRGVRPGRQPAGQGRLPDVAAKPADRAAGSPGRLVQLQVGCAAIRAAVEAIVGEESAAQAPAIRRARRDRDGSARPADGGGLKHLGWNLSGPGARVANRLCRDLSIAQRRMKPERPGRPCGAGAGRWVLEPAPGASPCLQGWPTRAVPSNGRAWE